MNNKLDFGSLCVQEWKELRTTPPHQLPIYATSSFVLDDLEHGIDIFAGKAQGHTYSRYGNPTIDAVAAKIAALETHGLNITASALLTSSGMSAIATLAMALLRPGDKLLTQGNLYGGTTELFSQILAPLGIGPIFIDLGDLDKVEAAMASNPAIRMVYLETPANPTMACVDIAALAALAKQHGAYCAIDNTFCTPYLQQPFRFGVDFVVHSTTKFLNGHGNSIAGIVIGRDQELMATRVAKTLKLTGATCNAWDAWLINNGLKTLELRMIRHSQNAMEIARFLAEHPRVGRVNYNGLPSHPDHELAKRQMRDFGGMLSFEVQGGLEAAVGFIKKLQFCTMAPTLGDVDTLVLHPASMSHVNVPTEVRQQYGITDGLVRVSVGIENAADIIADLEQALA
ncbi:MAG: aminotransferase class I/II-fold pyridoxal phosphate-dependent enzyme [Saprospiraceae bacterium]|nr:aminotransferase class I/II-fold pyridoxal phosphate-dependent enzyme [Saprospiraceae bacterium]